MPRYIDADALKNKLISSGAVGEFGQYLIDIQPAADVAPVVYAEWLENSFVSTACSNCGEKFDIYDNEIIRFRYCPNCGAKMDGEENVDEENM